MIADLFANTLQDGVQVFQEVLLSKIRAAVLLEDDQWYQVENVGCHPDNREKTGLVSIDAHDLVLRMHVDGFRYSLVDCVACQIPPNAEGENGRRSMRSWLWNLTGCCRRTRVLSCKSSLLEVAIPPPESEL